MTKPYGILYERNQLPQSAPRRRRGRRLLVLLLLAILVAGGWLAYRRYHSPQAPAVNSTPKAAAPKTSAPAIAMFNKSKYSLSDPTSIWVVVNKQRPLTPINFVPPDLVTPAVPIRLAATDPEMELRAPAAAALEKMFAAGAQVGMRLRLSSGYRSYNEQVGLYNQYTIQQGQAQADRESARAGHSEHQTGLAADIAPADGTCVVQQCFTNTPEGQWVAANAYKFGFIIRYTAAKEPITGYEDEPWHVRFVGTDLSNEMKKTAVTTLEEFFGLPAAPDYLPAST